MALKLDAGKFKLVGGHPVVDFVNTVGGRVHHPARTRARDYQNAYRFDKLEAYADLLAWSWRAKLLVESEAKRLGRLAEEKPREAEKVLGRAVTLRESIFRLLKSVAEGWKPERSDIEILNGELSVASKHKKLAYNKDGFNWEWSDRAESLDLMLWQISAAAAELLATGELSRLRQCGGENCGWMFLDTSRNHSRQWCDMKDCGNLAKVRRFRQKNVA